MPEPDLGYQLRWADYSGYVEGRTRLLKHGAKRAALPKAHVENFATRDDAEAAKMRLLAASGDGIVATVVPVKLKPPKLAPALLADLPPMSKRLTK